MSNSAITKTETSENIMNKLDSTVSTTAEISENIINKTDIIVTHIIISILTNLTVSAINAVNLNSESIVTDLDDSDELLKNMPSDIVCRSISH